VPNKFFNLSKKERERIIELGTQILGQAPNVIEKDIWVCWVLEHLSTLKV